MTYTVIEGFIPANGTEGDMFRSQNCYRCIVDHDWHTPPDFEGDTSCPLLLAALMATGSEGPKEWSVTPEHGYVCSARQDFCDCWTDYIANGGLDVYAEETDVREGRTET